MSAQVTQSKAEAEAMTRLRNYIGRSAGQHFRAIANDFAKARAQLGHSANTNTKRSAAQ